MRRRSQLTLTVLGLLWERPMHPYEMVTTLRQRGPVQVKHSSVYSAVDRLAREGLVVANEPVREGHRPERTVYALSEAGRSALRDQLTGLLLAPPDDQPEFDAALSLIGLLEPPEAAGVLAQRARRLDQACGELTALIDKLRADGLPYLAVIELCYRADMLRSQAAWVRDFADQIERGTVEGQSDWTTWHATGSRP